MRTRFHCRRTHSSPSRPLFPSAYALCVSTSVDSSEDSPRYPYCHRSRCAATTMPSLDAVNYTTVKYHFNHAAVPTRGYSGLLQRHLNLYQPRPTFLLLPGTFFTLFLIFDLLPTFQREIYMVL
nr:hypothetical protein HmN_000951000 [Hymenolepis microstoma]